LPLFAELERREIAFERIDVNALSNFVANAPEVIGFDPFVQLVELIGARAGLRETSPLAAPIRHRR
jgi:hypothetical protein